MDMKSFVQAMSTDHSKPPPDLRVPHANKRCSEAGYAFQLRHLQIFEFLFFASSLASRADEMRYVAAKALSTVDDKHAKNFAHIEKNPHPTFRKLQTFGEYLSEVLVTRSVDNLLSMLSETLQACMLKRPELLRSSEQVRLDEVLRFSNRRDLVDFLINRKINDLSYAGLRGIEEFLESRLGLSLVEDAKARADLSVAVELRNIYTHNRGVVNELFLTRLANQPHGLKFELGKRYHAGFDQIVGLANNMFDIALELDQAVSKKFKLQSKRFVTWDAPRREQLKADTDKGIQFEWFKESVEKR